MSCLVFVVESFCAACILNCDIIRQDEFHDNRCASLVVREDRVEGNVNEHWKTRSLALMSLEEWKYRPRCIMRALKNV